MGKSKKRARSPSRAADDGARGGEPAAAVAAAAAGPAETVAPPAKTGRKHARKNRETSPAAEPAAAPAQAAAEPAAPPAKTSRKHARKNRETSPTAEPAAAPAPAAAEPAAAIARRRQKSEPRGMTKAVDQARAKKRVLARDDDDDGDDGAGAVAEDEDTSAREIAAEAKVKSERTRAAKRAKKLAPAGRENGAEETEEQNDEGRMLRLQPEPAGSSNGAPAKHGQKGKVKSKTEARQGADESEAGLETGTRGSQEAASRGSEVENDIRRKTVARNRPAGKNDGASRKRNADKGGTQDADEKSKQVRQDSAHAAAAEISRSGKRHKSMDTGKESERLPDFVASKKEGASAGSPAQEGEGIEKPDDSDAGATKGSKSKKRKDESEMRKNEAAKDAGGKVGKSRGVEVDTAVEVVPNNVKAKSRVKSQVKENDSGGFHGKQKTADCKKDKTKGAEKEKHAAWNDWSQANFDGDVSRKNKFMRLMGAGTSYSAGQSAEKRENVEVPSKKHDSTISPAASKRIQDDLQKQFESGMAARRAKQRGKNAGIGLKS